MGGEQRRVAAQSVAHAQGLADNLAKQGFAVERREGHQWVLRKTRRRGDDIVTIAIQAPPMTPPPSADWDPPRR